MDQGIFEMFAQENNPSTPVTPAYSSAYSIPVVEKIVVISIGGSIILDEKPKTNFIAKLAQTITELNQEGFKTCLVVGGGSTARSYIASAKSLGANNFVLDELGISASRLNAQLLISSLENAFPKVLTEISQIKLVLEKGKIPVLAGLLPGLTTDCIAALCAEFLQADFINMTNVDGVYSANPKEDARARKFPELSYEKLLSLMRIADIKPGQNLV